MSAPFLFTRRPWRIFRCRSASCFRGLALSCWCSSGLLDLAGCLGAGLLRRTTRFLWRLWLCNNRCGGRNTRMQDWALDGGSIIRSDVGYCRCWRWLTGGTLFQGGLRMWHWSLSNFVASKVVERLFLIAKCDMSWDVFFGPKTEGWPCWEKIFDKEKHLTETIGIEFRELEGKWKFKQGRIVVIGRVDGKFSPRNRWHFIACRPSEIWEYWESGINLIKEISTYPTLQIYTLWENLSIAH